MVFFTCSDGSPNYHFPSSKVLIFLVWRDSHGTVSIFFCIFSTAGRFFGGRCGCGRFGTEIHMEKKKWRKGAGHILGSVFLLLGLDPFESFRSHFLVTAQHLMKNGPKMRRSTPIPIVGKFTKKKLIQLSPCFLPLIFFTTNLPFLDSSSHRTHESPPRDMHQDISPAVFGYNDWSNRWCSYQSGGIPGERNAKWVFFFKDWRL